MSPSPQYWWPLLKSAWSLPRVKNLNTILVVDLEATTLADQPKGALRDVIEIGVCELTLDSGQIGRARSILVQPTGNIVTGYCTELTGITPEQAAQGRTFGEAVKWLLTEYRSPSRIWASFGDFDHTQLAEQCARENIAYPMGSHVDIKTLAAMRFGWPREKGLKRALATLGLKLEGRHHSARDDAINAAKVLHKVLRG